MKPEYYECLDCGTITKNSTCPEHNDTDNHVEVFKCKHCHKFFEHLEDDQCESCLEESYRIAIDIAETEHHLNQYFR